MKSIKLRGIVAAVSGALLMGAMPAMADSTDDIVNALMAKGVLTEEEGALLMKGRAGEKEAAEAKKKSEVKASFKDGISFESGDKKIKMSINGRVQADYRTFHEQQSDKQADTWDIRRAYLGVKGTFYEWVDFEATANFVGKNGSAGVGDAMYVYMLNLRPWEFAQLQFGQFKQPMTIEELTSSRFINFTERSWVTQLAPAVDRGVMLHGVPTKGVTYAAGFFNGIGTGADSAGQNVNDTVVTHDGKSFTGRVTANIAEIIDNKDAIAHLGVSYSNSNDNTGAALKLRTEGRGAEFFQTGSLKDGFDVKRLGLEGVFAYGPVKLQSEYMRAQFENNNVTSLISATGNDRDIKSWNAALTWMVTGEKYADSYKNGKFDRIKPLNDFNPMGEGKGWGAWEIGGRYSKLDASDFNNVADTAPGIGAAEFNEARSWTVGVKWIPNPNTRFLVDYITTKMDCVTTGATCPVTVDDTERALNVRAQLDF